MGETILIVGENGALQSAFYDIFSEKYQLLWAENIEKATQVLKGTCSGIVLVLLGTELSEASRYELLENRKTDENLKNIPFVMITERDDIQTQVEALEHGANEFITLPITPEIVKARVNHVMIRSQYIKAMEEKVRVLAKKSEIDEMTGVLNKHNTEIRINKILENDEGRLDVLLTIDIDYFKTVNDTLGHQVGDQVIKTISSVIMRFIRKTDVIGRIGGDEFCVLLRDVPNMDIVYSKLRELNQLMKYKPNMAIPEYVSLSIGLASNERRKTTFAKLFRKTDEALYEAKQGGRGQYREYGMDVAEQKAIYERSVVNSEEDDHKKEYVLLVEDDPISRGMLRMVLRKKYEVLEAENGMEALTKIQEYAENLMAVVLDLKMPIMDGYQVLEQMKRNNSYKHIPIIISTAEESQSSDLKTLALGANIITHKPFDSGLMLQHLENLVDSYREYKNEMKQHMLQTTLIGNKANTFLCTYHFDTNEVEIGENYLKYMGEDFLEKFSSYPFQVESLVLPDDHEKARDFFNVLESQNNPSSIEIKLRGNQAYYEWFEVSKVINYDENHQAESVIFMFLNIQYAVEAKENLQFMAANDTMTQIPNMNTFYSTVAEVLQKYPTEKFAMITMDIFQFSMVNKLFGYKEGDNVIKYVATKLREVVEEYDMGVYGRASSDIFYICIPESANIGNFMQLMQNAMSMYPLKIQIKLCFGIYRIEDHCKTVEEMIEHSTFARKRTKEAPIKTFQYYDDKLKKKETFEAVAVAEMDDALKSQQFEVYYQPKCDIDTGKVIGAEALIRWHHPNEGYLSPAYFIPIFEQNGTCVELDYYVYEQVCRMGRKCLDEGRPIVPVSVNVSRWSLYNEDLVGNIIKIVDKYQLPHEYIEFEITESAFVLEANLLTAFSQHLRENGFKVLIDDFGSGYSSLNSLKDILVDILKIDIKFLPVSKKEKKAEIILSSIIDMGLMLGLGVIAEGVETKEQVELLKTLGCKCVQGYYFYRPMPYTEFQKVLEQ